MEKHQGRFILVYNIQHKDMYSFIAFNVVQFYPSISIGCTVCIRVWCHNRQWASYHPSNKKLCSIQLWWAMGKEIQIQTPCAQVRLQSASIVTIFFFWRIEKQKPTQRRMIFLKVYYSSAGQTSLLQVQWKILHGFSSEECCTSRAVWN